MVLGYPRKLGSMVSKRAITPIYTIYKYRLLPICKPFTLTSWDIQVVFSPLLKLL